MILLFVLASICEAQSLTFADVSVCTANTGCVTLNLNAAKTYSMSSTSTNACNSNRCPGCFVITGSGAYTLTITGCHYSHVAGAEDNNYVRYVTFANFGTGTPSISDGTNTVATLAALGSAGAMTHCLCKGGNLACT